MALAATCSHFDASAEQTAPEGGPASKFGFDEITSLYDLARLTEYDGRCGLEFMEDEDVHALEEFLRRADAFQECEWNHLSALVVPRLRMLDAWTKTPAYRVDLAPDEAAELMVQARYCLTHLGFFLKGATRRGRAAPRRGARAAA